MIKARLPSGRLADVYEACDARRPWDVYEVCGAFAVQRERRGSAGDMEIYNPQGISAVPVFDRRDAEALASALNARPGKKGTPRAPARPTAAHRADVAASVTKKVPLT